MGDWETVLALNKEMSGRKENILFLCQQVIEKCLKAVLVFNELPILLTHDLEALLGQLPDSQLPPHIEVLKIFTPYATIRRYEEGFEELTAEEVLQASGITSAVLEWAKKLVRK